MNTIDKESEQDFEEQLLATRERIVRLKELSLTLKESSKGILPPLVQNDSKSKIDTREMYFQVQYMSNVINLLQEQIQALYDTNAEKDILIQKQSEVIFEINSKYKKLNEDTFDYIREKESNLSTQYLNIEIYLDTDDPDNIFRIYSSILDFLKTIDFSLYIDLEAIKGSWWKRALAKSSKFLSSDDVTNRLKEAEYALEVQILKSQSEVDKNQSEALSNIMTSLKEIPNAAIRIGSLLVVKNTNETGEVSLIVQTLNLEQLHLLNKRPSLLTQPKNILEQLRLKDDDSASTLNL